MPWCLIDGKNVEFSDGATIIEAAGSAGIFIPHFCYHPGLGAPAQCRMCVVEVEGRTKLQTACSTPACEGMIVKTGSERVKQVQKSTMEFLLINHPLDCAICDKSGECMLQDNSYHYGDATMRTVEERRTYADLEMGPVIKKNMNRCIHCTRCIRFGEKVAGIAEMAAFGRGGSTEIATLDGAELKTPYAGNYSDICPTGALTLKDFRFKKRSWLLTKTAAVCEGCSRGCAIEVHHADGVVYRQVARENLRINRYWICDEGRFLYRYLGDPERVRQPLVSGNISDWVSAAGVAREMFNGGRVMVLAGEDLTLEEAKELLDFVRPAGAWIFRFGTPQVCAARDDGDEDMILRRKSKTSNLHGLQQLGISAFDGRPSGTVLVVRGGRAVIPDLGGCKVIGAGVFQGGETTDFEAVLPGRAFLEKGGSIVNCDGIEQRGVSVVPGPAEAKGLGDILRLLGRGGD